MTFLDTSPWKEELRRDQTVIFINTCVSEARIKEPCLYSGNSSTLFKNCIFISSHISLKLRPALFNFIIWFLTYYYTTSPKLRFSHNNNLLIIHSLLTNAFKAVWFLYLSENLWFFLSSTKSHITVIIMYVQHLTPH